MGKQDEDIEPLGKPLLRLGTTAKSSSKAWVPYSKVTPRLAIGHDMLAPMVFGSPASMAMPPAAWHPAAPGVWTCQIGKHDRPTLTEAAESSPRRDRLERMPKATLPFSLEAIRTKTGNGFSSVAIPLAPGEKVYGLGMQMEGCDRRGGVYHLRVDHYASGHDRLHAPTPLYISSAGYAVFLNTSRPVDIYVGVGNRLDDPNRPQFRDRNTDPSWDAQPDSNTVEASVQGAGLQVVVFSGPTAMDALCRYNLFCGGGALPPMWALGFWHRVRSLANEEEIVAEVAEFKRRGFPLDVLGLEPGWQSRSYPGSMEWDAKRFPDPGRLQAAGPKVNLWENPYVAPGSELFKKLGNRFGSHTVWLGAAPDILDPEAAKIEREFHTQHHPGVSGYKIDEVDGFDVWLWPDHAEFPSGPNGLQMRQIYGLLWQKEIDRMYRERNSRTFGLVRGSNGAASRFPFAIYSDTYDQRQYLTAVCTSPLAGVLWCAEIRSADSPEEWVRRMQSAVLSPIAQLNAWVSGKKPWSYPDATDLVRDAIVLRESLAPYLYTAFAQYWLDGTPPIRPMCLVDGGLETDQYMLGDNLLVAPVASGQRSRTVRLPKGEWFDYQTGVRVGSGETVEVTPSLDSIPLYVRSGAVIPTFGNPPSLDLPASAPITLRCFGAGPWSADLYDDDRKTFAYEKGDYGLFHLTVTGSSVDVAHVAGNRMQPAMPLARK